MGRRWFLIGASVVVVALVGVLMTQLLGANTVYYLEPREALEQRDDLPDGETFRLGGVVVEGSLASAEGTTTFVITDYAAEIPIETSATPPELFDEGIPVLLDGAFSGDVFVADEVILRHEEEYETPEGSLP
jgi:cytochrome c-type biogenesis protein CcmE